MNVTIDGYVSYICTHCKEKYSVEGKSLTFHEDTSPEAEEDEYIRYISRLDVPCASCDQDVSLRLDVWEYPESVTNYSYSSGPNVSKIVCEFVIEHYFNDAAAIKEQGDDTPEIAESIEDGADDKVFNESPKVEGYTDHYNHED